MRRSATCRSLATLISRTYVPLCAAFHRSDLVLRGGQPAQKPLRWEIPSALRHDGQA